MVDEESKRLAPEPVGAPPNRDGRLDPGVIEGDAVHEAEAEEAASGVAEAPLGPSEPVEEAPAYAPPPPRPSEPLSQRRGPSRFGAFVAGAVGGAVVAALAFGAAYSLLWPKAELAEANANRIATLESGAGSESGKLNGLEKRLAAVETAEKAAPQLDVSGDVKDLGDKLGALVSRVDKLESAPASSSPGPDASALEARVEKLEQALAAPKTENRVAPLKPPAGAAGNPAAVAIVAEAVHDRLDAGAPFPHELDALASLGVDQAKLAPLKAMSQGGPSGPTLAASFAALAPNVLAAANKPQPGASVADRFLAHLRGLVIVHDLNETAGDDPDALVTKVEALSRRGDVAGALAAFAKLPEPARTVAAAWAEEANKAEAASAALQSIRQEAIAHLGASEGQ